MPALPDEAALEEIVGDTLSWMNRVTKLKVGRDGFMFVVDKGTSRILAHPDENYVGRLFQPFEQLEEDEVIAMSAFCNEACHRNYRCMFVDYCDLLDELLVLSRRDDLDKYSALVRLGVRTKRVMRWHHPFR